MPRLPTCKHLIFLLAQISHYPTLQKLYGNQGSERGHARKSKHSGGILIMKTVRGRTGWLAGLAVAALVSAPALEAQTTTLPSTLRYGSGLMDIPVASVLPHMTITGTYSGFFMDLGRSLEVDAGGNGVGFGAGVDKFFADASVAVGLFDRAEFGMSLQSLNDANAGGNIWGLFGRVQLVQPTNQGIGLAVGGRYVTAPGFNDGTTYQPNRLGFPDNRFRESYTGLDDVNTELSLYGVATAHIRGFDDGPLPEHDMTFSLGYGTGMFQGGDDLGFYNFADSEGWFFGSAVHMLLGGSSVLTLMGEYNGFDVNVGAQVDAGGIRLGAQYLAANYSEPAGGYFSEYRKPKLGILASVALNPSSDEGLLSGPRLMERPAPDTIMLPAPPPDTVRITREVGTPLAEGAPASVCLATGEAVQVRISAQGDTLVGPSRVSIDALRPGVVFAGTYAGAAPWFRNDEAITFEERSYDKSGNESRLDCGQIMRVGEHMGVGLFAMRNADRPFEMVYVAVRPGVWQAYQYGLRRTRGQ
jgi:hypothetical protein